jgi:translation initiation factor IF-1
MVKNKKGGSKNKKMARKNVVNNTIRRKLRKAVEEGEMYACVIAVHGGGHASIICADKKERTLVIRGKFRGRNKRGNFIKSNSMVLVALRSVSMGEVVEKRKKEKADLIYVYDDNDIEELKQIKEVYDIFSNEIREKVDDDIFDRTGTDEQIENQILKSLDSKTIDNKEENSKLDDVEFDWDDI